MNHEIKEALEKQYQSFDGSLNSYDFESYKIIKCFQFENPNALSEYGWTEDFFQGIFVPIKDCDIFYYSASKEESGYSHNSLIKALIDSKVIYLDTINEILILHRTDPPRQIWAKEQDETLSLTSSRVGNFIPTLVQRKKTIFSPFETYFREHSNGAAKGYSIPAGEAFGIEIETLFAHVTDKLRFSIEMYRNFPRWICERDGSLEDSGGAKDCGLELVSPPMSYSKINQDLKEIAALAIKNKGKGHNAGIWFGMHINVNIYGNNKNETAKKFICLFNHPELRDFWYRVARRSGDSFEKYCPFKDVKFSDCLNSESGSDGNGHYRATFYRGALLNCVEVRIFRSSLKYDTISASIELCKLALDFCMTDYSFDNFSQFRKLLMAKGSDNLKDLLIYFDAMGCLDKASRNYEREHLKNIDFIA